MTHLAARKKRALIADLPRGVSVHRANNGVGTIYFRVRLGKKFTGGKPIYRDFPKLEEAAKWVHGDAQKESIPDVSSAGIVDLKERAGTEIFETGAKDIHEALNAIRRCREMGITLTEAVDYAIKYLRPSKATKTFADVVDFVMAKKKSEGVSSKHLKGMKSIYKKQKETFGKREIHTITKEEFEKWQMKQPVSPTTRTSYARYAHIAFAEATDSGWAAINPLAKVKRNSKKKGAVLKWTPEKLLKFLAGAMQYEPKTVIGIAIKAFGGIRTAEALRLEWPLVSKTKIGVPSAIAKTELSRAVRMTENLTLWVEEYRKEEGPVVPFKESGWHDALQRVAEKTGIKPPANVLRHSFGTYTFHEDEDEATTSFRMGSAPKTVKEWYVAMMVEDEEGKRWWSITPEMVRLFTVRKFDVTKWPSLSTPDKVPRKERTSAKSSRIPTKQAKVFELDNVDLSPS